MSNIVQGGRGSCEQWGSGMDAVPSSFGPDVTVQHTFPRPGLYKVWAQIQTHDSQNITAAFVVRVR